MLKGFKSTETYGHQYSKESTCRKDGEKNIYADVVSVLVLNKFLEINPYKKFAIMQASQNNVDIFFLVQQEFFNVHIHTITSVF